MAQSAPQSHHQLRMMLRYLLAGIFNTLLSNGAYWLLLAVFNYPLAYVLAFLIGVATSYLLMRFVVFQKKGRKHSWAMVLLGHLGQLAIGLFVVDVWVQYLHAPVALAGFAALLVSLPVMFLWNRRIFPSQTQVPSSKLPNEPSN